ncbi:MAG: ArsI/CadI family heavy metal resistance metalloenzyme [Ignavibacteriota bacterium]
METTVLYPHISLNVANLDRSLAFYRAFFNIEPVKIRPGYAKFELRDPKLNFTLNEKKSLEKGNDPILNHLGFQVESTDEVLLIDLRLRKLGMRTVQEESTVCCYALQDKIWVEDPDGVSWEVFVVHGDADSYHLDAKSENGVCCTPSTIQISSAITA